LGRPPSQTRHIAGRTVAWREAGEGPALVLLHGIGGAAASWEYQITHFAERYRVIAWDMPGYGASQALEDAAPMVDDYVAALVALLDALGPTRFAYEKGPAIMSPTVSDVAREAAVAIMARIKPDGFHQAVEMLSTADFFADAPQIAAPSLVLCGADDPVAPEPLCRSVAAALPNAKFHLLPGVGHYAAMENPALFNKTLEAFL
jgi:pimeloyl-ACP methyl ester carboxylesterase